VAKPELGTKRVCPACATKYYDLSKTPITCPNCGTIFEPVIHHRAASRAAVAPVAHEEEEVEAAAIEPDADVISLEEVDEEEAADVGPDVDADEGEVVIPDSDSEVDAEIETVDDPAFLEDEEEEGDDVADLLDVEGAEDEEV